MKRKQSQAAMSIAIACLVALPLLGYGVCYWIRLSKAHHEPYRGITRRFDEPPRWQDEFSVHFPSDIETVVFAPAVWCHQKLYDASFKDRCQGLFW